LFTANVPFNLFAVTYTHSLNGTWFLSRPDEAGVINAMVPGYVHEALQNAGWGASLLNENINAWGESEWSYTSNTFDIPMHIFLSERLELVFEGLDTFAEVYLNDQLILTSNNYFRTYVVDVSDIARMESNYIRVTISPPSRRGEELVSATSHPLPGDPIRAVARKPQYHYGWDWGPTITPIGIHGDVYIRGWDKLRLHDAAITTSAISQNTADLNLHLELEVTRAMTVTAAVRMTAQDTVYYHSFTFDIKPEKSGATQWVQKFSIDNPTLWWTHDLGDPHIYKCMVVLTGDGLEEGDVIRHPFATGIRTIALQTNPDASGESFTFVLNGEPVFVRGSNYIPPATFEATTDHRLNVFGQVQSNDRSEQVIKGVRQQLIDDAKAVNMNMLRVWGGGVYERDEFYSYCDQEGILVWQDFMYACAMYPGDDLFLANARAEAEAQVRRLRKHACIALWCGNN
jgi:beta-mannosidase